MAHEFETGVFMRGLKAWHSLGTVLPEGDPAETNARLALSRAGADWTVSLQPNWMYNPLHDKDPSLPKGIKVPGVRVIMRDTDAKILGNVGDVPRGDASARYVYELYQNGDMADWFQPALDAGFAKIEAAASLYGGQRVYMLARVGNGQSTSEIVPGDNIVYHWAVVNDHSGKHSLRIMRCFIRIVCANTLAAAGREGTYVKIRHTKSMKSTMEEFQKIMFKEHEMREENVNIFRALAKKTITKEIMKEYVQAVFPDSFKPKKETKVEIAAREAAERDRLAMVAKNAGAGKSLVDDLLDSAPRKVEVPEPVLVSDVFDSIEELVETGQGASVPGVRGTMWGVYNAVAEHLQYRFGRGENGCTERRMDGMFFGHSASANALALQKAIEFGRGG